MQIITNLLIGKQIIENEQQGDVRAKYGKAELQAFFMEMGNGFLFEKSQKRFTFYEDNYFVKLVLYNRLLRCCVLIDLKVDTLTHQDLGQMN